MDLHKIFKKDEWLSKLLKKNAYYLKEDDISGNMFLKHWEDFKKINEYKSYFIYSKINAFSVNKWNCLEKLGFNLVDTNVKFELYGDFLIKSRELKNIVFNFAKIADKKAIGEIARKNFKRLTCKLS